MRFNPPEFIKKFVLLAFLLMPFSSFALIKLNVETLMKNYIDEGLILSTEFNSSKILEEGMPSEFYLGEKLKFDLVVNFENDTLVAALKIKGHRMYSFLHRHVGTYVPNLLKYVPNETAIPFSQVIKAEMDKKKKGFHQPTMEERLQQIEKLLSKEGAQLTAIKKILHSDKAIMRRQNMS